MSRAATIVWDGERPPNARELRAIQNAYDRGQLRAGDRVQPGRVNRGPNVPAAQKAYTSFHWGERPKKTTKVRLPDYSALYELGRLVAVEYETTKGGESAIWVHKFSRPRPRLTATPDGRLGPIVGGRAIVTSRGIER